jgi:plasmid maintenance system antidote protein VapI
MKVVANRTGRLRAATLGGVLLEEFLKPMALSQNVLARYFGIIDGFFLRLQMDYELRMQKRALKMIRQNAA